MTKTAVHEEVDEMYTVVTFRMDQLVRVGYSMENAMELATDMKVDWHLAADLYSKCGEELSMRILT